MQLSNRDVDLDGLQSHRQNYNRHPAEQVRRLAKSLTKFGQVRSVVVWRNTLLAGHGVAEAARILNWRTVRADVLPDDYPEHLALAYIAADNELAKQGDPDMAQLAAILEESKAADAELLEAIGYSDQEFEALLKEVGKAAAGVEDAGAQVDKADELRQKWGTAAGQLWQLGEHRLICGDCTDPATVERVMGNSKADCVFTSPPYAVGVDYGETYQDTIDNLRLMLPKLSKLWLDIVAPGGFAVVNFSDVASGRNIAKVDEPCEYPMAVEYWPVFRADGWLLWSRRVWCKPTARVNSLWCIQSNRAATDWEHLWTWRKQGDPIIRRVDGDFSSVNGWIDTSRLHGVDVGKDDHGAGMATGIAEWMVTVHSRAGAVVHEPFCGTGTTLIACENLGRRCMASEISPSFTAIGLERWSMSTGKTPVLVGD